MDPVLIGILICGGFILLVITLMRIIFKVRKDRRIQQQYFEEQED